MGFRLRKSINIGKYFRLNFSKSGIGYSIGVPGMRYTKTASGRHRRTYSIPGTGLGYIAEDTKKFKKKTVSKQTDNEKVYEDSCVQTITNNNEEFIKNSSNISHHVDVSQLFREALIIISSLILALYYKNIWIFAFGILVWAMYAKYNEETYRYCLGCNNKIRRNERFCPNCGERQF